MYIVFILPYQKVQNIHQIVWKYVITETHVFLIVFNGVICDISTYTVTISICRSTWIRYRNVLLGPWPNNLITLKFIWLPFGRWNNIARENRKCQLCQENRIGDKFHYIMRCSYFHDKRESCIEKRYLTRINVLKFKEIISSKTQSKLRKLCQLIRNINSSLLPLSVDQKH